ncbi:MAG: hypothetical protein U1F98_00075 [Verrucomicrobiota bacterium]
MSRFGNLELEGEHEDRRPSPAPVVKDAAFYLEEARRSFERGEFEPALRHYSRVLEFDVSNPAAWTGQVRMLIELGEAHEARLWADKALERFPRDPELLAAKAVALGRDGDLDGALLISDASIQELGDLPYVWLARGDVLAARREQRADYCFEKARMLAPGDWFVAWLAGRIRYYHGQFALALKHLQQAVEWNAGHFVVWLELGRCQGRLGLHGPAQFSLARARELNPACRDAGLELARLSGASPWSGWLRRCRRWFSS